MDQALEKVYNKPAKLLVLLVLPEKGGHFQVETPSFLG